MANITIQFKRGTKANLEEKLVPEQLGVPAKGEPIWETDTNKLKIGDGLSSYTNLPYFSNDSIDEIILEGYYDPVTTYFYDKAPEEVDRQRLPEWSNRIYRDMATNSIYYFKSLGRFIKLYDGVKLYDTYGQNVDGAMTQKAVTNAVGDITFKLDENQDECLILNKPW